MSEPKIKLRDGWTWMQDVDGSWAAYDESPRLRRVSMLDHGSLADVVLAVIEANSPEVLREHVAGLATPVPEGECPRHYHLRTRGQHEGVAVSIVETPAHYSSREGALRATLDHRNKVAADCYPDLAARIAELEREVAALRKPSIVGVVCHACELQRGSDHAVERDRWIRTIIEMFDEADEDARSDAEEAFDVAARIAVAHYRDVVDPPVEWVDGRATVGEFALLHCIKRRMPGSSGRGRKQPKYMAVITPKGAALVDAEKHRG